MPAYSYVFGYENTLQRINNPRHGWDDEDSICVVIQADDEAAALAWGEVISQRYIAILFDSKVNWLEENFARWIEPDNSDPRLHRVNVGEFPDFSTWPELGER